MELKINGQQLDFLLDECNDIREGTNYSQYAKMVAQQLYDKLMLLKDENYEQD